MKLLMKEESDGGMVPGLFPRDMVEFMKDSYGYKEYWLILVRMLTFKVITTPARIYSSLPPQENQHQ